MSDNFYCLQIGQFLMTLPQHLEPFTLEDNPAVLVALKHGKLPYTDETGEFLSDLGGLMDYTQNKIICQKQEMQKSVV